MHILLVAPLVGAWIEMPVPQCYLLTEPVAPLVGAWIEIRNALVSLYGICVAPLVGAWIEIFVISINK